MHVLYMYHFVSQIAMVPSSNDALRHTLLEKMLDRDRFLAPLEWVKDAFVMDTHDRLLNKMMSFKSEVFHNSIKAY